MIASWVTACATILTAIVAGYILLRRTTIGRIRCSGPNQVMFKLRAGALDQIAISIGLQSSSDKEFFIADLILEASLGPNAITCREWVRGWDNEHLEYRSGFSVGPGGQSARIFFLMEESELPLRIGEITLNLSALDVTGRTHKLFAIKVNLGSEIENALRSSFQGVRYELDRRTGQYTEITRKTAVDLSR